MQAVAAWRVIADPHEILISLAGDLGCDSLQQLMLKLKEKNSLTHVNALIHDIKSVFGCSESWPM